MVAPVVVGVDGSEESLAALDWAAEEAVRRGAPLRLVHSWPGLLSPLAALGTVDVEQQQVTRVLREAEARARAHHPAPEVMTEQLPEDTVRALAEESASAGLLVLGSRGLGPVTGFLVGSVAQRVVGRAACPVVLVRRSTPPDGATAPADAPAADREVVVGVDPYDGPDAVLGFGFERAEQLGLPLRAVYAWTLPPAYQYAIIAAGVDPAGDLAPHADAALARVVRPWREKYAQVAVVEESVHARAAQVLAQRAPGADLVVIGRKVRRSPVGAHLGSVAHAVLHHVPCPVAVIPFEGTRTDA